MSKITRRDFLKLSTMAIGGAAVSQLTPRFGLGGSVSDGKRPNVLILLTDTTSAPHLSLYGYPRQTAPNLERFAGRATVYHAHYSAGNYTTPGTASLLTGWYPWYHRAVNSGGPVRRDLIPDNLFSLVGSDYFRIGYTQNLLVDVFLRQFNADLDLHLPASSFSYPNPMLVDEALGDPLTYYAFENFLVGKILATNPPGSVTMGVLDGAFRHGAASVPKLSGKEKLLPFNGFVYYRNRTVFQGVFDTVQTAAQSGQPFFGYFHLFSPHGPYTPTSDFAGLFEDGLKVPRKPLHPLISKKAAIPDKYQDRYSRLYDQYVANVDAEIGNLLDQLETSGLLDNTYVVLLSDHGQIFERGVHGHFSRLLYDQGIHIPLVILSPGQTERRDVYVPTSNVDLVPTLVALTGGRLPDGLDGQLLPGFGGAEDEHPVFCIEAKESSAFRPFDKASFALIRGSHKLIWYSGYPEADELVELYDLKSDPREMKDLSHDEPILVKQMLDELSDARAKADAPYARSSPDR